MLNPLKIPATVLFATVAMLSVGELAAGTKPLFVAFLAGTVFCIGITYNLLGGLSSISGIGFSAFAFSTIVLSQFAKVILFEAADRNLEAPELTIEVYFVFYLSALIGTFVYGRLRIRVPKPLEPDTEAQGGLQYAIALSIGLVANLVFQLLEAGSSSGETGGVAHSLGLAFSTLLLFSLVLDRKSTRLNS